MSARGWIVVLALPCLAAHAADDAPQRAQVEHKLRLVATLISDSPAAQRIAASNDAHARAHLDEGRVHHAAALDLLAQGDVGGAQRAADEALRHIGMARRMAPDEPARVAAARQRQQQLLGTLERLVEAWRERLKTTPGDDGRDLTAAMGLLAGARQLGEAGRMEEAGRSLALAERHVLEGMNRLLQAATLDYTPRFAGPAEEFRHELARHGSLAELVPLAIGDLRPGAEARALIDRYAEASRALRTQALAQFQAGAVQPALQDLHNATLYLERALTAAGLVGPAPTGATP